MAVPREITRIEVPDPEPMHPTPDGGAETQGAAYRLSAPAVATEPLTVTAPDGTALTWVPTELCYRDESGRMDYIVGSASATVQVRDREVRYQRTFPVADDVFRAEAERVKHWVILHEPPRAPAEYLSGAIEFGVTGLVSGVTLPEGRHDEIVAGPFRLPKPVARDLAGREIAGYYEVVPTDGGQQLCVWFDACTILGAVYPVTIDPTVTTSNTPYATAASGSGMVRAPDGSYYIPVLKTNARPYMFVYRSLDNGQTWADLACPGITSAQGVSNNDFAICRTDDGRIHVLSLENNGEALRHLIYDGSSWTSSTVVSLSGGGWSLTGMAAASADSIVHLVYVQRNNSTGRQTIYYRYFDGTAWQSGPYITIDQQYLSPDPEIAASGQTVVVAYRNSSDGTTYYAQCRVSVDGGATFYFYNVETTENVGDFTVFVDGSGTIHAVYYVTADKTIRRKQWTGAGWSAADTIATVTGSVATSIKGVASGADHFVFWVEPVGSTLQVKYAVWRDGAWSSVTDLAPSGVRQLSVVVPQSATISGFLVAWTEGDASPYTVRCEIINLADPPDAPILEQRTNFDATKDAVFSWEFSDPDPGDGQTAYQLVIKRASDDVVVYDTGKVASTSEQHVVPAGTLQNGVMYRWTVRTWDAYDLAGPYASEQSFRTSAQPVVTITAPASDGLVVGTSSYTVEWSTSDPESKGQTAYRIVLRDGLGNVVHDSGKVQSTAARAYTLQELQNNTSYTVELTVWDGDDVASDVAVRTFNVQYAPPPTPDVTVEALEAWVRITIANNNAGAEVQAVSNDVYRRKVGEAGNGIRIATNVPVDGVVYDYAVASGVAYEYRVVAIGTNGTTAASQWVAAPVLRLTGAWLHDPANPAETVRSYRVAAQPERGEDWEPERALLQFAGRSLPVAEFGEHEDRVVRCTILIRPDQTDDLDALRALAARRSVVCYRDSAGRRIFGVLGPLNIRDERHGGYTVEIEIQAVDYDEAV